MKNITFIIAVRKGSKRVKNKNTRKFGKYNLLEIKLKQIRRVYKSAKIFLSSDCQKSLLLGKKYKAHLDVRDKKYTNNKIPMPKVYKYLASKIKTKYLCYLHVTSPFLSDRSLKKAVQIFLRNQKNKKIDCVATVTELQEYLWDKKKAINYNPKKHPRSQDLKKIVALNFAANIVSTDYMKKKGRITTDNFYPIPLEFPETIDIDDKWQFLIGDYLERHKKLFLNIKNDK
ncbi:hypothetical protein OAS47_02830 [Pelagibacteraceae bacterium]|nr:hypothetical protein [Pelagibacteraceae bacterium]